MHLLKVQFDLFIKYPNSPLLYNIFGAIIVGKMTLPMQFIVI